ncbi:hypothetical protein F5Y19DRAFT_60858 [Xylariaceae sp. FL1651]|nr:hypothetical protein F5Y19DRAFT_60858 [Xylariaceae sp. FL1651]
MADLLKEREGHVLKHVGAPQKTSKPLSDSSRHRDVFFLHDPEYREHAGEVRRRNDRSVRAEPPPPQPAQPRARDRTKPNQGRKKQTSGFDNDDSDSDHDSSKRDFGEKDGGITVRKKIQPPLTPNGGPKVSPEHNAAGPSGSMALTPDEEERVQLQRNLTRQREADEGGWQSLLFAREFNRRKARQDMLHALDVLRDKPEGWQLSFGNIKHTPLHKRWPNTHVIQIQQLRRRRFLDEALCHDVADTDATEEDNCLSNENSRLPVLEDIIKQAEEEFVTWGEQFITLDEPTVQGVVKGLWTQDTWLKGFGEQSLYVVANGFGLDPFAARYGRRIWTQLGLSSPSTETYAGLNLSVYRLLYTRCGQLQSKYLDTIKMLSESRQNDRLSKEYIEWVCMGTSQSFIDSCCQQRRQQVRGSKLSEMLGIRNISSRKLVSTSTIQEFCQDIDYDRTLSLVLFKGGIPFSIKPVSSLDQNRMGWYRVLDECIKGHDAQIDGVERTTITSKFYCYELDEVSGHTFKVGVNGEFLGLWTPHKDFSFE